jgi:molybdate transport system ATP-binding protein
MHFMTLDSLLERYPQIQMIGNPGSGKSSALCEFMSGKARCALFSVDLQKKIQRALAPFWQQRFISLRDDDAPRVRDLLLRPKFYLHSEHFVEDHPFPVTDPERLEEALSIAALPDTILKCKLLSLSNGELRRVLLARTWMENPECIVFDDLFGGLDSLYRVHLSRCVLNMAASGVKMVISLQRESELLPRIPAFVFREGVFVPYEGELPDAIPEEKAVSESVDGHMFSDDTYVVETLRMVASPGKTLFALCHVNIHYGNTEIIRDLSWQVRAGEHWVVMGPNGAGKSTLLALLSADHPQIYDNDIALLGKKPGQGLNVWEHKAEIGFFSPELAVQYREKLNLTEVLCTGYTPALGLFRAPTWEERKKAREWLTLFGFTDAERSFDSLSVTEKRLVLIARAAIRPPQVLILDEATQGMDVEFRTRLFDLLQFLSERTTLIFVTHYEQEWPPCMTHVLRMPKFSLPLVRSSETKDGAS